MHTVLIADDHPLFRAALRDVVEVVFEAVVVHEASTLDEARDLIGRLPEAEIDLILLDLQMPGASGYSGLIAMRNAAPSVPVVVVSAADVGDIIDDVLTYGAAGFIPKSFAKPDMADGIRRVLDGDVFVPDAVAARRKARPPAEGSDRLAMLTQGELRVLDLLSQGKPNKIIAYELGIKEATVKAHITAILRKLRVHSRTQAVLAARDLRRPEDDPAAQRLR
jgi:DNA-binding NarL/FixJ family response regulator